MSALTPNRSMRWIWLDPENNGGAEGLVKPLLLICRVCEKQSWTNGWFQSHNEYICLDCGISYGGETK